MRPRIAAVLRVVRQCVRKRRRDVLDQRSAERDIQELRTAANCKNGLSGLARGVHKSYFSLVAEAVHSPKTLVSRLSVECGIDIFTAGEDESVDDGHDAARSVRAGERRNDDWYEPCYLESGDIGSVEPNVMSSAQPRVGCRGNGNSVGCSPGGIIGPRVGYSVHERG